MTDEQAKEQALALIRSLGVEVSTENKIILGDGLSVELLPLDQIKLNKLYQRNVLSNRKIRRMVKAWNPAKAGLISVAQLPDGQYYSYDGGHRVRAMDDLGIESAWCFIVQVESTSQAAELFVTVNNDRDKVTKMDRLRAELAMNERAAVHTFEILDKYGYSVSGLKRDQDDDNHKIQFRALDGFRRNLVDRDPELADNVLGIAKSIMGETAYSSPPLDFLQTLFRIGMRNLEEGQEDPFPSEWVSAWSGAGFLEIKCRLENAVNEYADAGSVAEAKSTALLDLTD